LLLLLLLWREFETGSLEGCCCLDEMEDMFLMLAALAC